MRLAVITVLAMFWSSLAMADTIVVDGTTYRDVKIKDSGSRYYFYTSDGTAMSVDKSAIGPADIALGDYPLLGSSTETAEAGPEEPVAPAVVSTAEAVELPPAAPLEAGAATVDLLRAGRGGLEANALVIAAGEHILGVVSLDLAAVDRAIVERIFERLNTKGSRLTAANCIIAATGRYTDAQTGVLQGPLEQVFFGEYMAEMASQIVSAAIEALSKAEEALSPAVLRLAEAQVPEVHESNGTDGAALDSTLTVVHAATEDGIPLGYVVNFALYPAFGPNATPVEGRGAIGSLDAALEVAADTKVPVVFLNGSAADTVPDFSRGEEPVGDQLGVAVLDALAQAEPMSEAPLIVVPRNTAFPPTLLEGLVPREAILVEAHLGDTLMVTAPASVSAQAGVLLRVKAMQAGNDHIIIATHADGFAGLIPSVDGFFTGDVVEQSSFYGPLAGKWLAETYLPGIKLDPPVWENLPELKPYAGTFAEAIEKGKSESEAIQARYEAVSQGLAKLTSMVRNAKSLLGDKAPPELERLLPVIEGLDDAQLQAIVKQLAAALFRSEAGEFTAEQRVRLMGAAEGAGIPFDAVVLLQALSDLSSLPEEAQLFVRMAQAQGGDIQGYAFY